MSFLSKLVRSYYKAIILIVFLLTILFGYYAQQVEMTTDIKDFFPRDHPQVLTYDEIEEKFGGAEYIMVAIEAQDVFSYSVLTKIDNLTQQLEKVSGVASVRSLTNVEEVKGTDWGVEVASLIDRIPADTHELGVLKQRVLSDQMYSGMIVAQDGTAALMIVEVDANSDSVAVATQIHQLVKEFDGPEQLYLTGTPFLNAVLADSMQGDLIKLFPMVLLLVALILYLNFRSLRGVVLPFVTVLISVIWTLGVMGLLGKRLSPLNAVMPVILVSLGNAYGIYLLARYHEEIGSGASKQAAVQKTLSSVGIAVLLAGSTTVFGFASNITSSITQMKDFGLFTAFGVLTALLISLVFIPAMLMVLSTPQAKVSQKTKDNKKGPLVLLLDKVAEIVTNNSKGVILVAAVIVIIAILGMPRISTDSNFFNFFDDSSEPKVAYNLVGEKFSGSESIEIVIKGDIQSPASLQAIKDFQTDLEATGLVGTPTSLVNILERTNMALNEGNPEFESLPHSRELVAQYLLLLEMSGAGYLDRFLTMDYQEARIQALVKDSSTEATSELFTTVEELFHKHFANSDLTVTQTGIISLLDALASMIIEGQIRSLIFSLLTVFVIVRLLLGSWEGSLLSTLLIFLTTLANFGLMGWGSIPLDIVTVLISSIGVGVGIDYSIHIYSRYQEERRRGLEDKAAISNTITSTGKAIVCNAGAVITGFLILLLSSFPPFRYFGSLVTITMFVAATGSLTVLPALILVRVAWQDSRAKKVVSR